LKMGSKCSFSINSLCLLFWVPMLLFVPLQWIVGWTLAAIVHELGHLLILLLFGIKIYAIRVDILGTKIETELIPPLIEAVCAIFGPAMGLMTVMLRSVFPQAAISAVVQTAYNALPVFPLDGGRTVLSLLSCILPFETARKTVDRISRVTVFLIILSGVWLSVKFRLGILPVLFPAMPMLLTMRKNSLHCRQKNSTIQKIKQ